VYNKNHIQNSIEIHITLVAMATVHTGNFHDIAVFSIMSAAKNMGLNSYISVTAQEALQITDPSSRQRGRPT
jgi:archaellum biogenesis protein FlaJ (TadC family)